jgi:hypothetical protein
MLHPVSDLAAAKAVDTAPHHAGGGRAVAADPDGNVPGPFQDR